MENSTGYSGYRFHAYVDGSGGENGQPGGYAAVVVEIEGIYTRVWEYLGFVPESSSQRMELAAAGHALHRIPPDNTVSIFSDSAYVINGMNQKWHEAWERRGWRTASGDTPKNLDLWAWLVEGKWRHVHVFWTHIPGHQDDENDIDVLGNNRADGLAGQARRYGIENRLSAARHWRRGPAPLAESPLAVSEANSVGRRKI